MLVRKASKHMKKESSKKIRIILADDHPIVRTGIKNALAEQKNIEVVGEASNGVQALKKAKELSPDIVLMDISMPGMGGLEAAQRLRATLPKVKVLVFTMHDNKEYVLEIIRSGASGYVLKDTSTLELVRAIETVYRGGTFFSSKVSQFLLDQYVKKVASGDEKSETELTNREKEVLVLVAKGKSNKEIASELTMSTRTVETHREKIMKKLNVHSVAEMTQHAISRGLVKFPQP
jgi:two-component system, NarL family, nitrate/nitrite response regulator NarL